MTLKIRSSEPPEVSTVGNRKETSSTSVLIEDGEAQDILRLLNEHGGMDADVTIKFKD